MIEEVLPVAACADDMPNPDNSSIEASAIAPIGNVIFLFIEDNHSILFINRDED